MVVGEDNFLAVGISFRTDNNVPFMPGVTIALVYMGTARV